MRKLNVILLLSLFVGVSIFTSCQKDDDPIIGQPLLIFKSTDGYAYEDVTIKTTDELLVGFIGNADSDTDNNLTNFVLRIGEDVLVDSTFNAAQFTADYRISFESVGNATLTAKITDAGGFTDQISFEITIEEGGVQLRKSEEFLLGHVNDLAAGSFYSATEDEVYFVNNVQDNVDKVDLVFFMGVQNKNTLASPDDEDLHTVYPSMLEWTVHNATRLFKTDMTAAEFDALEGLYVFPEYEDLETKANHLENGDVVYFVTASGKQGYVKVVDLYFRGDVAKLQVIIEE